MITPVFGLIFLSVGSILIQGFADVPPTVFETYVTIPLSYFLFAPVLLFFTYAPGVENTLFAYPIFFSLIGAYFYFVAVVASFLYSKIGNKFE